VDKGEPEVDIGRGIATLKEVYVNLFTNLDPFDRELDTHAY
jgi:hypothetical protein